MKFLVVWTSEETGKDGYSFQDAEDRDDAIERFITGFPERLSKMIIMDLNYTYKVPIELHQIKPYDRLKGKEMGVC